MRIHAACAASILLALALAACAGPRASQAPDYAAIVAAPDRSDADRQTDRRRDPATLLLFTRARPGMKVLDMGAGGGYSTELLARAVAPTGVVYAQDSPDVSPRAKERFEARMKTPAMKNVVRLERPFDDPAPPGVHDLHGGRPGEDEPRALRRAQAGRGARDRRPFGEARRRHERGEEPAPHRGRNADQGGRGRGLSPRGARRVPAPPRGPARHARVPPRGPCRRVRAEVRKAALS